MKKILTIALIVSAFNLYAQDTKAPKEKEQSNAEKFSDKSGSLIQKEFEQIGEVGKCKIQVVHYKDMMDGHKVNAVLFEYEARTSYGSDTKMATLDADEVDGLISSINIIKEKVFPSAPANYTEVNFKSRSGFSAGCYSKKEKWTTFLKLQRFDSNSYVWLERDDFDKLLPILQAAKGKLL